MDVGIFNCSIHCVSVCTAKVKDICVVFVLQHWNLGLCMWHAVWLKSLALKFSWASISRGLLTDENKTRTWLWTYWQSEWFMNSIAKTIKRETGCMYLTSLAVAFSAEDFTGIFTQSKWRFGESCKTLHKCLNKEDEMTGMKQNYCFHPEADYFPLTTWVLFIFPQSNLPKITSFY